MANEISITHALQSLKSGAEWVLRGDVLEWLDSVQTEPTKAEIDAEIIRLQAEYDTQEYARKRAVAYPSWQEQMDLIYHSGVAGLKAELKKTKDTFPKE